MIYCLSLAVDSCRKLQLSVAVRYAHDVQLNVSVELSVRFLEGGQGDDLAGVEYLRVGQP